MTREMRTMIEFGDVKALEIECAKCHHRIAKPADSVFPLPLNCPAGCGAVWMPYRDALKNLQDAIYQLKTFSTNFSADSKPPFSVRLEVTGGEKL